MSAESLLSELDVDFRPDERALFFQEAKAAAESYASTLGREATAESPQDDETGLQTQALLDELERETAEFSPVLPVVPLRRKHFVDLGLQCPPHIAHLMRRFDFYLVHFPITLVPKPGWGFQQLDCIVEFNPDQPPTERPVVYHIFPQEDWEDIIRFQQGLAIGLDENLEFKVDLKRLAVELPNLDTAQQAKIGAKAAGLAGLVVGPFNYRIRRPKIVSRGQGNVKVRWRLESEAYVGEEEPQLGVVLQVPKDVSQVNAVGALKVGKDFHTFTAHLRHLMRFVRERTRTYFERGAPLVQTQPWKDITAGL